MYALSQLTLLLPPSLRPYAKAVYPAVGTAVAVGVQWIATGAFDKAELVTALVGGGNALLTFFVRNHTKAEARAARHR